MGRQQRSGVSTYMRLFGIGSWKESCRRRPTRQTVAVRPTEVEPFIAINVVPFVVVNVLIVGLLVGAWFLQRWSRRRYREREAEYAARGETMPRQNASRRVIYILLGVVFLAIGIAIYRH